MSALEWNLRLSGAVQLGLALAHLGFGRRFAWADELARLSLLNRQIFYVHTFFVALVVAANGALGLLGTAALLTPGPLAQCVAAGWATFWICRLLIQGLYFDRLLWRGQSFNTRVHWLFVCMFTWFSGTYGWLWLHLISSDR